MSQLLNRRCIVATIFSHYSLLSYGCGRTDITSQMNPSIHSTNSRNQLFELSGRRAVYPQFFLVETTRETQFLGDADEMEAINDASSLDESVLAKNPYAMTWERLLGCPEEEARLVYLMSSTPLNLKTLQRQQRCELILRARNISFLQVDGSSPGNKVDRNALFGISGISAQYPQFFLQKTVVHTSFLGDAEDITAINDASNLPPDVLEANPSIVTWDKVLAS